MPPFAAEMELLRHAARHCLPAPEATDDPAALLTSLNWHHVLWLGRQHGALLFLRENLRPGTATLHCPGEIRTQLEALSAAAQLQALVRTNEICQLHDLFERHGIPFIVSDDWMFDRCFSAGRNFTETIATIRCLVDRTHSAKAKSMLAEAGYPDDTHPVQIATLGRSPVHMDDNFDPPGLWENPDRLAFGTRKLRRLDPLHWLWLLSARIPAHRTLTLLQAWQIVALTQSIPRTWQEPIAGSMPLQNVIAASCDRLAAPRPAVLTTFVPSMRHDAGSKSNSAVATPLPVVPFLPTSSAVVNRMIELAETNSTDVAYDLGCGDGRFVIRAAKDWGARAVGIDLDPTLIAKARRHAAVEGVSDRVSFVCSDLFECCISDATVLYLYLMPPFYPRIREQILRTLRPGVRIVSRDYIFPDWPPEKTEIIRTDPAQVVQIYLWRIG